MPAIERQIRIAAPVDAVWRVLTDLPRQPLWMRDLRSVEILTEGPVRVGTVAIGEVRMLGLSQRDPIEVTAFDPPTMYAIAHLGAFVGTGEFRLFPMPGGVTQVRWREKLRPTAGAFPLVERLAGLPAAGPAVKGAATLLAGVSDPLFAPVFALVFREDLRRLRDLVEAETGPGRQAPFPGHDGGRTARN